MLTFHMDGQRWEHRWDIHDLSQTPQERVQTLLVYLAQESPEHCVDIAQQIRILSEGLDAFEASSESFEHVYTKTDAG